LRFKVKLLGFEAGKKRIIVIDDEPAKVMGIHALDRVIVRKGDRDIVAIVNIARYLPHDTIAVYDEVAKALDLRDGDEVEILPTERPASIKYIRNRMNGVSLSYEEVYEIIKDIVEGRLSDIEIAALVTALHLQGMNIEEAYYFSKAMVETGKTIELDRYPILDKHSLGGVPGDKTTMLVVPIIASLGHTIPKTSSRAITSPAGTADRVEVLCPVDLSVDEIKEVVSKTNGCMVWGGALGLAPADDIIIRVEYPLSLDPFFIPSIMAKKKSVGATHVVLDIPTGRGTKVKTIGEAHLIARSFIEVGKRLGMKVNCAITLGEEPVGYTMGPALEAWEALNTLMGNWTPDLVDKATSVAGVLLEMVGVSNGKAVALEALRSGKAEKKFREIIEAQGGDPNVKPDDIPLGDKKILIRSEMKGPVLWINNSVLAEIAKLAGAPKDKGAGVRLYVKIGDRVKAGDPLFEIYSESEFKLDQALKVLEEEMPFGIGRIEEMMLIDRIPTKREHRRPFILER